MAHGIVGFLLPQLMLAIISQAASDLRETETPATALLNLWCTPTYNTTKNESIEVQCTRSNLLHWPWKPVDIDLQFFIYNKTENDQSMAPKILAWNASVKDDNSTFSEGDKIVVISHGYTQDGNRSYINDLRRTFFNHTENSEKLKVIQLDWPKGALGQSSWFKKNYVQAATNVPVVGRLTAEFLYRVHKQHNISGNSMHLVGHSLGGHVVGEAAAWLFRHRGIKTSRVTALDPASPLFSWRVISYILLNKTDTNFLEVFHTSASTSFWKVLKGAVGLYDAVGHVDFYPNNGTIIQPTCRANNSFFCSHNCDHVIYNDILTHVTNSTDFNGTLCSNVEEATTNSCTLGTIPNVWQFVEQKKANISKNYSTSDSIIAFTTTNNTVMLHNISQT